MSSNYPAMVREHLTAQRRRGVPFDLAWPRCQHDLPMPPEFACGYEDEMGKFLRIHMCSAYNRDGSTRGRFKAPEPEGVGVAVSHPLARATSSVCRSGDGCRTVASHGRFGSFCHKHANELRRLWLED